MPQSAVAARKKMTKEEKRLHRHVLWKRMRQMKMLYLFLAIPFLFIFAFDYVPLYGIVIAFKDYRYADGIWGSAWNNFEHFKNLFQDILFQRALVNTLVISFFRLTVVFICPVIFAVILNELTFNRFKRVIQTISYLPHFISWVIIGSFAYQIFSPESGIINTVLSFFGKDPIYFMGKSQYFLPIFIGTLIWQSIGWGSIIYLASMSSISPELYESAELDGASRLQKALHITLPGIAPMVTIQFILGIRGIMKGGFDPVYNMSNGMIIDVADTIDTFVFRQGILGAQYDYSTAVGLFQNIVGLAAVLIANKIAKKINDYGIW